MLKPFVIHEPQTVEEASALLAEYGLEAALYAGGTELLVVMREGLATFPHLINVKKISGLDRIDRQDEGAGLRIGAGVTHRALETSPLVVAHAPLLARVAGKVANLRVRVAGTLGGNLCFAEPHSDPATLLTAWPGADFELASATGTRRVAPADFFVDLFMTDRREDEVMTAVRLPALAPDVAGAYQKFAVLERPSVTVTVFLKTAGGVIQWARLAVGSVGPKPSRASEAEALLVGETPSAALYKAAGEAAARAVDPVGDLYGSIAYKRHLVSVLTARALQQAVTDPTRSQYR